MRTLRAGMDRGHAGGAPPFERMVALPGRVPRADPEAMGGLALREREGARNGGP